MHDPIARKSLLSLILIAGALTAPGCDEYGRISAEDCEQTAQVLKALDLTEATARRLLMLHEAKSDADYVADATHDLANATASTGASSSLEFAAYRVRKLIGELPPEGRGRARQSVYDGARELARALSRVAENPVLREPGIRMKADDLRELLRNIEKIRSNGLARYIELACKQGSGLPE